MPIETLFFDLGGVLIQFSHKKMCENIAKYCELPLDQVNHHLFEEGWGEKYERGELTDEDLFQKFKLQTNRPITFEGLFSAVSDIFSPMEEMDSLIKHLKEKGYRLFLLSNTCKPHFARVQELFPFLKDFDGFILSYEVKARKPEKEIYDNALTLAQTIPHKSFYVDDVSEYVQAAKELGINSHQFIDQKTLTNELKIRQILSE